MDNYTKNQINYSNFNNNSELDITDTQDNIENFSNTDRGEPQVVDFNDLNSKQFFLYLNYNFCNPSNLFNKLPNSFFK